MRIPAALSAVAPVVAVVALCAAAPVRAETTTCTPIPLIPATITSAGVYCVADNATYAASGGAAISIQASNVTIDCNGRSLVASAGDTGNAVGLLASNRSNLTVRGCNLQGFATGIHFEGGNGHLIEDNRIDSSLGRGISVTAGNFVVRRNAVRHTGGGVAYPSAEGIWVDGSGEVRENIVVDVHATTTSARGIHVANFDGGVIAGNHVHSVMPAGGYVGHAFYVQESDRVSVRDNTAYNGGSGGGLSCPSSTKVAVTGNHLLRFEQGVVFCTLSGDRNVVL